MRVIAWILCILSFLSAFWASALASTSIHQIYGALGYLTAAVLFGVASLLGRLDRLTLSIEECSRCQLQWLMDAYKTIYATSAPFNEASDEDAIPFKDAMKQK